MQDYDSDIEQCLKILRGGGVILYPTDTIWGIGCDATNAQAVERIFSLKKRPGEKTMIVLVADEKEILRYVSQPDFGVFDYLKTAERPTTVVYKGAIGLADNLTSKDGSIAIRICKEGFCRALIKRFRKPIVSTSANLSGESFPKCFAEIGDEIKEQVDYIVQYRQDDKTTAIPSALIKWQKGKAIILRS